MKVFDAMRFFGFMKNRIVLSISRGENNMTRKPLVNHPYERAANEPILVLNEEWGQLRLHCLETKVSLPIEATNRKALQSFANLQMRLR